MFHTLRQEDTYLGASEYTWNLKSGIQETKSVDEISQKSVYGKKMFKNRTSTTDGHVKGKKLKS